MIPSEILQTVFFIKYGDNIATCFSIWIEKKNYLITAKHLFPGISSKTHINIEVLRKDEWIK